MSVLIKGMEMPKDCEQCPCSDSYGCAVLSQIMATKEKLGRPDWCPLAEVKESHGRLIDEDDIDILSLETSYDQVLVYRAIREAPTIIEAEEGE